MKNYKQKINSVRAKGFTIKYIAQRLDVSPNTLYGITGGNYKMSKELEWKLDNLLDELLQTPKDINTYSVYIHQNKQNSKVYIGLTSLEPKKRWQLGKGYKDQPYFYRAILKYGWDGFEHLIIKSHLSKEEASNLEKDLIIQYDSTNSEKGYNLREGGINNYTLTNEQKSKRAWAKGKKFSKEHCENISKGLKNRVFSEETKEKMSEAKLLAGTFQGENNPKAQKVICIETQEIFNTLTEAANWCGLKSYSSISKCCKGIQKTAGGYHWSYYNN